MQTVEQSFFKIDANMFEQDIVMVKHGAPLQQLPLVDIPVTLIYAASSSMRMDIANESVMLVTNVKFSWGILNTLNASYNRRRNYQRANGLPRSFSSEEARLEIQLVIGSYLDFLNSTLAVYSPIEQIRLNSSFQVYDNPVQQELIVKGLVFEYYIAGVWLPFTALSDGTKEYFT